MPLPFHRTEYMRGLLSFLMLWILSKGEMNGQELAREIGDRRGSKPTPGTLYPALSELERRGLVVSRKHGRCTTYQITQEGAVELEDGLLYFCRAFGDMLSVKRH